MGKSKQLFLIALLTAVTVSGCWDRKEINDVGFILATGLDKGEGNKLKATVHLAVPSGLHTAGTGKSGGGQEPVMIMHSEGATVEELKAKLQAQFSRRINTSHRGVIIVGEEIAKEGLHGLLDEVSRAPMNRLRAYLIVAKGTTAAELMKVRAPIEAYPSEAIREMEKMTLGTVSITLRDFFVASTQPGQQPVTTAFTVSGMQKSNKEKAFRADGIALFRRLKLVGYLEGGEEVMGYGALRGKLTGAAIEVTIPEAGNNRITIMVRHSHSRAEVEIKQGKPVVRYHIDFDATVSANTSHLDLINPDYIRKLNLATAAKVKQYAATAIKTMQKNKADALGMGAEIYRKEPRAWETIQKKWETETFPNLAVEVDVEANVRQIGMMGPPLQLPDSEVEK